ncbi:MAG: tetratricopeptide repeat protein [Gallionella sp.]|nr:tetratricopeptide repeat protein [Gallionella sp.]
MAALDLQEQEQFEALKAWWRENSKQIFVALLLVAIVMGGWRGWQYYQQKQSSEAATLYGQFLNQMESNDIKRVNDAAAAVMNNFASTAYAPRAALLAAQANEQVKDAGLAKTQLQWVISHAKETGLKDVARLRLAAIMLDEKNYDSALNLLETPHPSSFDSLYADLRGDVLSAQGKTEEAKSAYKLAYEKTDAKSMYRNLIQMKLDALGAAK